MGLLRIQQELAAILMEPQARKAFAKDPHALLAARGIKGRDRTLLASLVPDDLAYFAERRNIDRLHALRADAPRATRLLESAHGRLNADGELTAASSRQTPLGLSAYFRAYPYSLEDPVAETARFARWARGAARAGDVPALLPDLALFEATALRLLKAKAKAPRPSPRPRRAPGVRVLRMGHALGPALGSGDAAKAGPGPAAMALRRTGDDVLWQGLSPLEAELLRTADGKRPEPSWVKTAAKACGASLPAVRKAARGLVADGYLAPLAARRRSTAR
ncbi:MAG: hypothetical protein ACYC2H_07885 [Thermoplasmatota archaeon]